MKAVAASVLVAVAASLVGCSSQQASPGTQALSPTNSVVMTEGTSARLVDGWYEFSLTPCPGANTFLLTGRLTLTNSQSTINFSTDPSGREESGQQWIQAGIYSGAFWNDNVAPCTGLCVPTVTSAEQLKGCGWTLKLHLTRAGQP